MAHKTLIGGTAYDIAGGNTLIGGTGYGITGGRTLIGGTGYDLSFSNLPATGTALAACTPEQIQAVAQAGLASSYWSVGDIVSITLNGTVGPLTFSNEIYYAFILGFDHNSTYEGSNTIHFQFGKTSAGVDIAWFNNESDGGGLKMNAGGTNVGGWASSYMRQTLCVACLNALPTEWQNVIVACAKYTDNTGNESDYAGYVTSTSDKIWLLSEFEFYGKFLYANRYEQNYQKQYDYYANGNSAIKYKHNATDTAAIWWLRSPARSNDYAFCRVTVEGYYSTAYSYNSYGFAPGFMVA